MTKKKTKTNKNACDILWAKIIKSYGECERCHSKTKQLQAAHIYSRSYAATRHDLNNGLCLCTGCHFWAHKNPIDFTHWVEEYIGGDIVSELTVKAKTNKKTPDYASLRKELKEIYAKTVQES